MGLWRAIPTTSLSVIILATTIFGAPTADENLSAFLDQEWQYFLKEFPIFATFIGDYRYNDKLGDFLHNAILNRQRHDLAALNQLDNLRIHLQSKRDRLPDCRNLIFIN